MANENARFMDDVPDFVREAEAAMGEKVQFRRLASVHVACTSCHTDLLTIPGCPFST